jgi:hypothetical protein
MGTLVLTFRLGGEPQRIRYVTLQDAQALQVVIRRTIEHEQRIARIRTRIKALRERGCTDAQIDLAMRQEGGSLAQFERLATTWPEHPIKSYCLIEDPLVNTQRATSDRVHMLQPRNFASAELCNRGLVQAI